LPFGKFVFCRHFPTYDNPYGTRLLSRCFWPVFFKRGGLKFWVTFCEKYGMPFLFGQYRRGATDTDQTALLNSLASMVQDAVAIGPEGSTVSILQATGSASSDNYQSFIAAMDAEVSKVIMGHTLTAEVSERGGAYAQSRTAENVLEAYREGDEKLYATFMEDLAWIYGQVNAPGVPTPNFAWYQEEDPLQEFADGDKTLCEGDNRLKFAKSYYVRRYGFQEDDFEFVEPPKVENVADKNEPENGDLGKPGDEKKEFAEQTFTPAQQAIEKLIAEILPDAFKSAEKMAARVAGAVQKAETYEDLQVLLAEELAGTAGSDELEDLIHHVMLNSHLFGMSADGEPDAGA
jgi:phage gp29-like protein